MQVKRFGVSELKGANYNPKSRSSKGATHMKRLQKSIEEIGLIYPIAITADNRVIDGHRRLQAVKNLGWEQVECIIVNTDNPEHVFAEVNATGQRLNGNHTLRVFLKQPAAVTERVRNQMERMKGLVGGEILRKIANENLSVRVISQAQRILKYTDTDSVPLLRKTVGWLINHRNSKIVESYMIMQQPPKALYDAIKGNRNLQVTYQS